MMKYLSYLLFFSVVNVFIIYIYAYFGENE
jgi:hypothetical protein